MTNKTWAGATACVLATSTTLAAAQDPAPRFSPLTPDKMTAEQKAAPSIKRALEAGTYNPGGFDAVTVRNPALPAALGGLAAAVYPAMAQSSGAPSVPSTLNPGLAEIGILMLAQIWNFPAMFKSHGPHALKDGVSQQTIDALAEGRRPARMKDDEAAIYDFCSELLVTHRVSDAAFAKVRLHLSERDIVDLVATLGVYTNSLMLLKVADNSSH